MTTSGEAVRRPIRSRPGALGLVALAAIGLGGFVASVSSAPSWPNVRRDIATRFHSVAAVDTRELASWLANPQREQPLLIDVRTREEYEVSHLPGAVWAATAEQQAEALRKAKPGQPVVLYCSVGWRSAEAAVRLGKKRGRIVLNLDGSIFQWANEDRPLVTTHGAPARVVHPFNRMWGGLLDRSRWSHEPKS
ncbi:MAG: rhodanese-like domain-containing protein [Verrucomicrobia bacterium]|nr:rhodanese-like domain-containing protein [Verrucomicrobiota bacterium]